MHQKGVVHRDLKLENILLQNESDKTSELPEIKLIDFGTAGPFKLTDFKDEGMHLKERVGTPAYMAPEVFTGKYTHICDVWSVGIIAYILLCGFFPFAEPAGF